MVELKAKKMEFALSTPTHPQIKITFDEMKVVCEDENGAKVDVRKRKVQKGKLK